MDALLSQMTWWHWLALGLLLFGIEMMTGTFDLLMIAIAAWATSVFAGFAPPELAVWQGQLLFFGIASAVTVVGGRLFFSGRGRAAETRPSLNRRMIGLVGQKGLETRDFEAGSGQVRIGDTVWSAEAADGEAPIHSGDNIIVEATRSNIAIVRRT
jgi:membrane protein implicated in regulation of membrane protease activity